MPEDLKLSQIGSSPLPPPFRGLHSPGVRKHCQLIFACYFRKSSIINTRLDSDGKCSWVTTLRLLLHETGFGYVWLTQRVGDELHFIRIFRHRLTDINFQDWVAGLNASSRFDHYRQFKTALNTETYLDCKNQTASETVWFV